MQNAQRSIYAFKNHCTWSYLLQGEAVCLTAWRWWFWAPARAARWGGHRGSLLGPYSAACHTSTICTLVHESRQSSSIGTNWTFAQHLKLPVTAAISGWWQWLQACLTHHQHPGLPVRSAHWPSIHKHSDGPRLSARQQFVFLFIYIDASGTCRTCVLGIACMSSRVQVQTMRWKTVSEIEDILTHGGFFGILQVLMRASATAKIPISCKHDSMNLRHVLPSRV